jgi:hypothetical protein
VGKSGVNPYPAGKSTHIGQTGSFRHGAKIVLTGITTGTLQAGTTQPPHTDSLTDCQTIDRLARCDNPPDHLVTGNQRILADTPIVIDQVQIAVTQAAGNHLQLDIHWTQRIQPGSALRQRLPRGSRHPCAGFVAWFVHIGYAHVPCIDFPAERRANS